MTGKILVFLVLAGVLLIACPAPGQAAGGGGFIITVVNGRPVKVGGEHTDPTLALIREEMRTVKPGDKLSSARIGEMAKRFGLTDPDQFNFRMAMNQGDFSFYAGQNWPAWRIIVELAAKRLVLEAANRDRVTIPSKGDWSAYAEQVMDLLPVDNIRKGQP